MQKLIAKANAHCQATQAAKVVACGTHLPHGQFIKAAVESRIIESDLSAHDFKREIPVDGFGFNIRTEGRHDPEDGDGIEIATVHQLLQILRSRNRGGAPSSVIAETQIIIGGKATGAERPHRRKDVGTCHGQMKRTVTTHRVADQSSAGIIRNGPISRIHEPDEIVRDEVGPVSADGRITIESAALLVAAIGHDDDQFGDLSACDEAVEDCRDLVIFDPNSVIVEDAVQEIHHREAALRLLVIAGRKIYRGVLNFRTVEEIALQRGSRNLGFDDATGGFDVGLSERLFGARECDDDESHAPVQQFQHRSGLHVSLTRSLGTDRLLRKRPAILRLKQSAPRPGLQAAKARPPEAKHASV